MLRRDRIIITLALILLTAFAWSYLLWLSADMGMGSMDMSGFRRIPSSMGAHDASARAVAGDRVRIGIRHVDRDDGQHDGAFGGADDCNVCPCGQVYPGPRNTAERTAYFGIGYVLVWAAFSLFATLTQWALERAGLLDAGMATTSNFLGGVIFVAG
jgi:predicted metal-binding membrane protein